MIKKFKISLLVLCAVSIALMLAVLSNATNAPVADYKGGEGVTAYGHSAKVYGGMSVVNTWWAYYEDTKTLEFISATDKYNETGDPNNCEGGASWGTYKNSIEHIIIGDYINKITGYAFSGLTSLKDIRVGNKLAQIDPGALSGCSSLSTIWRNGSERIEGRADLREILTLENTYSGTAIKELVLPNNITEIKVALPSTITTLYSENVNDNFIVYARDNKLNLIDLKNPKKEYNYYEEKPEGSDIIAPTPGTTVPSNPGAKNGHSSKTYSGMVIVDVDWVYNSETKTLEFISKVSGKHNETGTSADCDAGASWGNFKKEIEHIIVGDNISKVTTSAFFGIPNLVDVRLGKNVTELDPNCFGGCSKLTTVWRDGTDRVAGRADFSKIYKLQENVLANTAVEELVLAEKMTDDATNIPTFLYTIYTPKITDALITFAKNKQMNLIDINDPSNTAHKYYDPNKRLPKAEAPVENFVPTADVTDYGHMSRVYNNQTIVNTWWVFYESTKTLEFISATSSYNETGTDKDCEGGKSFGKYRKQVEHIIIGDNIGKISTQALQGFEEVKDIRLGVSVREIDYGAFNHCKSLTTVWYRGTERIEGRADLSRVVALNDIFLETQIKELLIPDKVTEFTKPLPLTIKNVYTTNITESMISYAEENLFNLINPVDPNEAYKFYIEYDESLPSCGPRAVFDFDEATGTLTVSGGGAINDLTNYYGGGSKKQWWFSFRDNIKHVVIGDYITRIGKYAFCECKNLETVEIPNVENFEIGNAAFEKCTNLRSVYRRGTEAIEGTVDIRNVAELFPWTFAYDYLIANVVINGAVESISTSNFEENTNLANIYGTPGSYAETYASENGLTFYDIASNEPQPIKCEIPEITESDTEVIVPGESETEDDIDIDFGTDSVTENEDDGPDLSFGEETKSTVAEPTENNGSVIIIVAAICAVVLIALVIAIIFAKKKSKVK